MAPEAQASAASGWRIGDIVIDAGEARVTVRGQVVELDRSGYALLLHLLEHAGQVFGKDDLLRIGWPGRVVSENSLAKAISKLRHAIGDDEAELIRVVHGYGYRLAGQPEAIPTPTQPAPDAELATEPRPPPKILAWVALVLVLVAAAALVLTSRPSAVAPPFPGSEQQLPMQSIAVLPFRDLSEDGSLRHFADGLADQLLDSLSQLPYLRLAAPTSSFAIRDPDFDLRALSQRLGVQGLVVGSIRRSGPRLRITLQLVDGQDGFHRWSQTFERPETELFALQDDLTAAITRELRHGIIDDNAIRHTSSNAGAYAEWLRARTLYRNDETGERRYIAAMERVLAIDPQFADAWIELANVLGSTGLYADNPDELRAGRARAFEAVERGIALAPGRPDGYLTRAVLRHAFRDDIEGALADLERADALSSHPSAESLVRRARLLATLGRLQEAIALGHRAIAAEPLSVAWTVLGWHYLALGDLANARKMLAHDVTLRPDSEHTRFYLGLIDIQEGRPQSALTSFEQSSGALRLVGTVIAQHELGHAEAARRALATLEQRYPDAAAYQIAEARAWLGDLDGAFAALAHAHDVKDAGLTYLKFDPLLANLRDDPRYRAWLARLKLPLD